MQWYDYLKTVWNLDVIIVAIVFLSGFFQERFLRIFIWSKDTRFDAALKTAAVSVIVSTLYILAAYREAKYNSGDARVLIPWGKYLISFFTATSLYDMGIRPLRKWLKKKFGDSEDESTPGDKKTP